MAEKLANRAQIDPGHHESRRKAVTVAMPRIVDDPRVFRNIGLEPERRRISNQSFDPSDQH
jgi:hypothetical protein